MKTSQLTDNNTPPLRIRKIVLLRSDFVWDWNNDQSSFRLPLLKVTNTMDKITRENNILKNNISPAEYCCKALNGIEKKPQMTKAVMPAI